jgi:hypothetical protein
MGLNGETVATGGGMFGRLASVQPEDVIIG